jgi:hypothetical protein
MDVPLVAHCYAVVNIHIRLLICHSETKGSMLNVR